MHRIKGMTVLITGASAGIGEACAQTFASYGAHLVLTARRLDRLEKLKRDIEFEHDVSVEIRALDVRIREEVDLFARELEESGVEIDVLVNNAGLSRGLEPVHEGNPQGWDEVNASHTFHDLPLYYPMRVVRTRRYKLIWNIAHGLPYPFAYLNIAFRFPPPGFRCNSNDQVITFICLNPPDAFCL